jgi:hypothetical protein
VTPDRTVAPAGVDLGLDALDGLLEPVGFREQRVGRLGNGAAVRVEHPLGAQRGDTAERADELARVLVGKGGAHLHAKEQIA